MQYYLSLGSNTGNRLLQLQCAYHFLQRHGEVRAASAVYQTAPVGMKNADYFYNMCMEYDSPLPPLFLLRAIKAYENSAGRDLTAHLQSRPIDIDILFADQEIMQSATLTIPHPRLAERAFVLIPLMEIAPQFVHPVLDQSIMALHMQLPATDNVQNLGALFPQPHLPHF